VRRVFARKVLLVVLFQMIIACVVVGPASAREKALLMATTTSTDNTGLLDYLAPRFKEETGIELMWTAVVTGKALALG